MSVEYYISDITFKMAFCLILKPLDIQNGGVTTNQLLESVRDYDSLVHTVARDCNIHTIECRGGIYQLLFVNGWPAQHGHHPLIENLESVFLQSMCFHHYRTFHTAGVSDVNVFRKAFFVDVNEKVNSLKALFITATNHGGNFTGGYRLFHVTQPSYITNTFSLFSSEASQYEDVTGTILECLAFQTRLFGYGFDWSARLSDIVEDLENDDEEEESMDDEEEESMNDEEEESMNDEEHASSGSTTDMEDDSEDEV